MISLKAEMVSSWQSVHPPQVSIRARSQFRSTGDKNIESYRRHLEHCFNMNENTKHSDVGASIWQVKGFPEVQFANAIINRLSSLGTIFGKRVSFCFNWLGKIAFDSKVDKLRECETNIVAPVELNEKISREEALIRQASTRLRILVLQRNIITDPNDYESAAELELLNLGMDQDDINYVMAERKRRVTPLPGTKPYVGLTQKLLRHPDL